MDEHYIARGTAADGDWDVLVPPERAGWRYSGVRSATVAAGGSLEFEMGGDEGLIVPLNGGFRVALEDGRSWVLRGRPDVFSGPTDVLYVPVRSSVRVTAPQGGRFALATARAEQEHPVQLIAAEDIPVFVRGRGAWSRLVRDFGNDKVLRADRLVAVEVVNPGGNWSGIPRHKHDTPSESESQLEEIYLFEAAPTPGGPGYGLMRVSASGSGAIDLTEEVRTGDVVLVPFGWHGPVTAPPESDLYYLNVMAGSTGRTWNITDSAEDAWVRERWEGLDPDLRR